MPGLVKVGYSSKDPELRAKELNSTGSPCPYVVEYEMLIDEPFQIEQKVHNILSSKRKGKEWVECSAEDAVGAIQSVAGRSAIDQTFKKIDRERVDVLRCHREEEESKKREEEVMARQIEERLRTEELQILKKYDQLDAEYIPISPLLKKYWIGTGCLSWVVVAIFFQIIELYETVGGRLINSLILSVFISLVLGSYLYFSSKDGRNRSLGRQALSSRRDKELASVRHIAIRCNNCSQQIELDRVKYLMSPNTQWVCPKCKKPTKITKD